MRALTLDDIHDPRLTPYSGVSSPESLRDRGLALVEGRLIVRRLLAAGRVRFRSLLLNDAAFRALKDVLEREERPDVFVASPPLIEAITGFHIHRGCLAIVERPAALAVSALTPTMSFVVVLERVTDTDNVGVVFRNAEAFGVDAVVLSPGCGDPFYRKAIRTSSGATLTLPSVVADSWPNALLELRAAGFAVVALTPDRGAATIGEFVETPAASGRVALLFGTEGDGLTNEALAFADARVRISMHSPHTREAGWLDSLNIATAAGIALHRVHEVRRRVVGRSAHSYLGIECFVSWHSSSLCRWPRQPLRRLRQQRRPRP